MKSTGEPSNGPRRRDTKAPAQPKAHAAPGKYMEKADIVLSINGRDEGKRFLVIDTDNEYSLLADGRNRRVEKPKRKKNKHLILEDKAAGQIAQKILAGEKVTNSEIRRTLAGYSAGREVQRCDEGGM